MSDQDEPNPDAEMDALTDRVEATVSSGRTRLAGVLL
jgi:hypothetical protein